MGQSRDSARAGVAEARANQFGSCLCRAGASCERCLVCAFFASFMSSFLRAVVVLRSFSTNFLFRVSRDSLWAGGASDMSVLHDTDVNIMYGKDKQ